MRNKFLRKMAVIALCIVTAVSGLSLSAFADGGTPPDKPDGQSGQQGGGQDGEQGSHGGANTQTYDYSGSYNAVLVADGTTKSSTGETYKSSDADKNVALAQNGGKLKIVGDTLSKSGDDSDGDRCNFYGVNSSVLAVGSSSEIYISDSSINSTSEGSNGLFATDGATIYANNDSITTTKGDNARGLDATYGGKIIGNKLTISTAEEHCAALATDRGGGYISLTNSSLKTAGSGSPLIYSTGAIEVDNVSGTASGSQIAGMEGENKILIYNSNLQSTSNKTSGSDPIKDAVILYQSTSGDADTSTSSKADFEVKNSTLKTAITGGSTDAAFFYVTNVTANVVVENTKLDYDSDSVYLMYASGNNSNNWGTSGSNGGKLTFTAINEAALDGDIYVGDTYSSADVYLTKGTVYTGKTVGDGVSMATVNVDATSTWVVSDDCSVGALNVASGGKLVDSKGRSVTIKTSSGTVQSGNSDITVTVTGKYGTSVSAPATSVSSASVSRTEFDSYYGTDTTFGQNGDSSDSSDDTAPATTTISKLTGISKGLKAVWVKKSGISGYQIKCGTNKACTKNTRTFRVKSASTTSKTIKGLKKKTNYYVKIRTYKGSGTSIKYSAWSAAKKVKTK